MTIQNEMFIYKKNSLLGWISDGCKCLDAHTPNLEFKMLPDVIGIYSWAQGMIQNTQIFECEQIMCLTDVNGD